MKLTRLRKLIKLTRHSKFPKNTKGSRFPSPEINTIAVIFSVKSTRQLFQNINYKYFNTAQRGYEQSPECEQ